jgi:hypothetical protein
MHHKWGCEAVFLTGGGRLGKFSGRPVFYLATKYFENTGF